MEHFTSPPAELEQERPLSQKELGNLYDKIAKAAIDLGRRYSIPEAVSVQGYLDPLEFRLNLNQKVLLDTFSTDEQCTAEYESDDSFLSFSTPYVYDELDQEQYTTSAADLDITGKIKGTDIERNVCYRIENTSFLSTNIEFRGDFIQLLYRDGHIITEKETVLTEAGVVEIEPEVRRELTAADRDLVNRLLFALNKS